MLVSSSTMAELGQAQLQFACRFYLTQKLNIYKYNIQFSVLIKPNQATKEFFILSMTLFKFKMTPAKFHHACFTYFCVSTCNYCSFLKVSSHFCILSIIGIQLTHIVLIIVWDFSEILIVLHHN